MKVYVMLGDGFEEIEALAVVDVTRRAAIETLMVSVTPDIQVTSARGIQVTADRFLSQISVEKDDMIVIPGGKGIQVLEGCEMLKRLLIEHRCYNGPMAAICAGPSLPGKLGLLKGIKATCFPGYEQYLLGAQVVPEGVAVDQRCVTAKGAGVSLDFAYAIVAMLQNQDEADKLRKIMQFPM